MGRLRASQQNVKIAFLVPIGNSRQDSEKEVTPVASVAAMMQWVVQHAHRARRRMERETPLPLG
jgi:hypothetical protein